MEEEWRENFHMSRTSLYALAVKLRPYVEGEETSSSTSSSVRVKQSVLGFGCLPAVLGIV